MSGFDKHLEMERLKALGWTVATEDGTYLLRPPKELLEKLAAKIYYVYDARDLQEFAELPDKGIR